MLTPFAEPEDIALVWRPLSSAEKLVARGLIAQAGTKLRMLVRGIDRLIDGDELLTAVAHDAVVNAVKRVLMNPEGLRQRSSTTGPFTDSDTVDTTLSSGQLYIDVDDITGLIPSQNAFRSFRIRPGLSGR
jgi:hypothetical protein